MADTITNSAQALGLAAPELVARPAADLPSLGAAGAAAAGLTVDHKDEARELGSGAGFRGQSKADNVDCQCTATEAQREAKRFATLRARLALAGWALHRADATGGSPAYTATRWGRATEPMSTLEGVARFADQVGAPS